MKAFETESELTETVLKNPITFRSILDLPREAELWQRREVKGLFGIPDLVIAFCDQDFVGEQIRALAFEMKRSNWKRALTQAYRYSSFADFSYVLMDRAFVHRALAQIHLFERSNIGLISVTKNGILVCHYSPEPRPPYSKSLRHTLETYIRRDMGIAVSA
jgi:hypothetical protein